VCVCLSVCLSVMFNVLTFESLGLENSFLVRAYIVTISRSVCQGHRVEVKVAAAKTVSMYPVSGWPAFD